MIKHFVRTFATATLVVGSLVVVAAQPASAFRYFVHGNVHCTINSGHVDFAPTLRETISQTTRLRIKGTFTCDQGETGVPGTVVTGGKFKMISNPYGGNCTSGHTDEVEMVIQWTWNPGGVKVRNTEVSWVWDDATDTWAPDPTYQYHFVGGTTNVFGLSGSYTGATAAANFVGLTGSAACHQLDGNGRLRGGFSLDTSGASDFTFQSAPFINQATGVNPNSATLGTQNLDVDITGQDFTAGDTVSFSGTGITVNSTTVNSASDMTANISIDPNALAGTRDVTVTNATLGSNTCAACFMVSPIVTGASPATAGQGATNRNITITGQGFENGAFVQFSGSGITTNYTQFIDANTLNANISVAPAAPLTSYDVIVTDPGNGVGTCTGCFSVNGGPAVTSTNPGSRGAGATNQTIAINGSGFQNGATVTFGGSGISVGPVTYVDSTQLQATVSIDPGATFGPRSVTVLNPDGGQGGCAVCFTVNKPPIVTLWQVTTTNPPHRINPNPDPSGRKDRDVVTVDVSIFGTSLQPGTVFTYPAAAVTTLIVNSQTYVSATKIKQNITVDYADFSQLQANPPDRTIIATNPDGGTTSLPGAVILVG